MLGQRWPFKKHAELFSKSLESGWLFFELHGSMCVQRDAEMADANHTTNLKGTQR
jgi:hypothetical protein